MPSVEAWSRAEAWTSSLTVPLPSGLAAGDTLLLLTSSPAPIVSVPSGWQAIYSDVVSDPWGRLEARCYWRTAGASESAPVVTFNGSSNVTGALLRVASAGSLPIHVSGYAALGAAASSVTAPSLTPTVAGTLAITAGHAYYRWHSASPSGYAEILAPAQWEDGGGNGFLRIAAAAGPAAGVVSAAPSWPCVASSLYQIAGHVLIAPASVTVATGSSVSSMSPVTIGPAAQTLSWHTASAMHPVDVGRVCIVETAGTVSAAADVTLTLLDGCRVATATAASAMHAVTLTPPEWSRGPGEQYAYTLRISHPALPAPICLVADSHPIDIAGEVYQPWPLRGVTPARHEVAGEASIDVCIVDRTQIAALHAAHAGGAEPVVEFGAVDVVRAEAVADRAVGVLRRSEARSQTEMTLVVGPHSALDAEPMSITFTPGRFPALFRS